MRMYLSPVRWLTQHLLQLVTTLQTCLRALTGGLEPPNLCREMLATVPSRVTMSAGRAIVISTAAERRVGVLAAGCPGPVGPARPGPA